MAAAFRIGLSDFVESLMLYRLWLHQGRASVLRQYQRTVLGPIWHTLSIALFVVVMGIIWSTIMKVEFSRYMTFLPAGLVTWGMLSGYVLEGSTMLVAMQGQILSTRTSYPMLAMALVWKLFLVFLHQIPLCIIAALIFGGQVTWATALILPGLVIVCITGVWMALLSSLLTLKFRDAQTATATLMQVLMFATPIFWSKDLLGKKLAHLADWNPMFHLVELIRQPVLGHAPSLINYQVAIAWMIIGMLVTILIYGHVRRRIAYWF